MQLELIQTALDLSDKRTLVSLSGGINSAAVLCYLASEYPQEYKPRELHLFAVQLEEHSSDTFRFMKDCIRYAYGRFECVRWTIRWGSVLKFFEQEHMIPHPILSPCSEHLKIIPINNYMKANSIDVDLVGYVRTERNRIKRQIARGATDKAHPIAHLTDEDCFTLVKREIGWYPAIYDIKRNGKRVFHHNNCLPCKNMGGGVLVPGAEPTKDYEAVKLYYPEHFEKAERLSEQINSYWGRVKVVDGKAGNSNGNQMTLFEDTEEFDGHCKFCEF